MLRLDYTGRLQVEFGTCYKCMYTQLTVRTWALAVVMAEMRMVVR